MRLNAVPPRTNPLWSQQCFSAEFQVCVSILTICTALALAVVGGLIKGQGGWLSAIVSRMCFTASSWPTSCSHLSFFKIYGLSSGTSVVKSQVEWHLTCECTGADCTLNIDSAIICS